ncbi:MAG: MBL fold metallo-hydrolase [Cyanobacteria bacterium P01_D01_bin.1]
MNRRDLLKYASAGFLGTVGLGIASRYQTSQAQTTQIGPLTITALGHTAFLFAGGGKRVLVNPFKAIGCTAGYTEPEVSTDVVLISSLMFDEGFVTDDYNDTLLIEEPGDYSVGTLEVQGISMPHDRMGGRRFGTNVAWAWNQAGVNVVHLGGAAAPIAIEDKILLGRPDVLLLPVGGGPKAYGPEEAVAAVDSLNPKIIIPTHYRTQAADDACDLVGVEDFIALMSDVPVTRGDNTFSITPSALPSSGMRIEVLSYAF